MDNTGERRDLPSPAQPGDLPRVEVLRRDHESEVEFVTVMTFDSLQNVIEFQGEDYQRAYVPDAAQAVLSRWDKVCAHYETIESREP